TPEPIPEDAEKRLGVFTELVATAVTNLQARDELRGLADEQAALRRVATLVAEGVTTDQLFWAVAKRSQTRRRGRGGRPRPLRPRRHGGHGGRGERSRLGDRA